jgi:ubiquinone biosynthesis protein Coq4
MHDLFHIVTGYGQDPAGEAALLAFNDGMYGRKFRLRVVRFGLLASVFSSPPASLLRTIVFALQARRRAARSRIPFAFRWEEALELSLDEVRAQLEIAPASVAHPRGMLRGVMESPWSLSPHEASLSFSSMHKMS